MAPKYSVCFLSNANLVMQLALHSSTKKNFAEFFLMKWTKVQGLTKKSKLYSIVLTYINTCRLDADWCILYASIFLNIWYTQLFLTLTTESARSKSCLWNENHLYLHFFLIFGIVMYFACTVKPQVGPLTI